MRKHRLALTTKQQIIVGTTTLVVTIIASIIVLFMVATKPYRDAEKEITKIARQQADIDTVTDFNIYNGKETYYGLLGQTQSGERLALIVSKQTGQVDVYKQSDGISQSNAQKAAEAYGAQDVSTIRLGKYEDTPIWEVKAGTQYYLVGFLSGQVIKVEGL